MIKEQNKKMLSKLQEMQKEQNQCLLFRYNKPINKIYFQVKHQMENKFSSLKIVILKAVDLRNLANFPKLIQLQKLDISKNSISEGFNHLLPLENLQYLDISKNIITQVQKLRPLIRLTKLKVFAKDNPFCRESGIQYFQRMKSVGLKISQKLKLNKSPIIKRQKIEHKSVTKFPKKCHRLNTSNQTHTSPHSTIRQNLGTQSLFRRLMASSALSNLRMFQRQQTQQRRILHQNALQQGESNFNIQKQHSIYDIINETFSRFFKRPRSASLQQSKEANLDNQRKRQDNKIDKIQIDNHQNVEQAKNEKESQLEMESSKINNGNLSEKEQNFSSENPNSKQPYSPIFAHSSSSSESENHNQSHKKQQKFKISPSKPMSESQLSQLNLLNSQKVLQSDKNSQEQESKIQRLQPQNSIVNEDNQPSIINDSVSLETQIDDRK